MNTKADFCLSIEFQKESESPSRVFRAMSDLIETFQTIDRDLARSIDISIEPIILLEDIEAGSLKTWLKHKLESVNDEGLKNLDWKKIVGGYLLKSKYQMINFLDKKTEIKDRKELESLQDGILKLAQDTDVKALPDYTPLSMPMLVTNLQRIQTAISHLQPGDKADYIIDDGKAGFNIGLNISPEAIEELITREIIKTKSDMILKVKKPDYLGQSRWEFRYDNKNILVKISDMEWLSRFQSRKEDIRPGDSIKAYVETSVLYGYDNDVVNIHYDILKVHHVIQGITHTQNNLFNNH